MAEEYGQPGQPAQPAAPAPVADPAVTPAPAATPQPNQEPTKYGGKTPDEILAEVQEKDRYISQLNERIARAEYEAQYNRTMLDEIGRRRQEAEAVPRIPVTEEEYVQNPLQATAKVVETYLQRERAERERKDRENYIATAKSNYESGRTAALRRNPDIFKGIDKEVATEVFKAFDRGAINADTLRDPDFWETSAALFRLTNGDWDLGRYRNARPMAPTYTETPGPSRPPQAGVSLTPEQEEAARLGGFSREQFEKLLAGTRTIEERRAR